MSPKSVWAVVMVLAVLAASVGEAESADPPEQDPVLLRFVERAMTYYPDSTFRVTSIDRRQTPSGSYRLVEVDRACAIDRLSGPRTVVIDDVSDLAWFGSAAQLPLQEAGVGGDALRNFLNEFLPGALKSSLRMKASLDWTDPPHGNGALLSFWLVVDSGYGEYRKAASVTSDGAFVVLGPVYSLDEDPVEYRHRLLSDSEVVVWDHMASEDAPVEIVEFSDLECPACRRTWPTVKAVLEGNGSKVNHGMVSFPLTVIHPWSFRSSCASWCVSAQQPDLMLPFKELFYDLQTEMGVSLVTPTAMDFVTANGLDEAAFENCYLKAPSLDAVHGQLALGHKLGIMSTPTYVVNGYVLQVVDDEWLTQLIDDLAAGKSP